MARRPQALARPPQDRVGALLPTDLTWAICNRFPEHRKQCPRAVGAAGGVAPKGDPSLIDLRNAGLIYAHEGIVFARLAARTMDLLDL